MCQLCSEGLLALLLADCCIWREVPGLELNGACSDTQAGVLAGPRVTALPGLPMVIPAACRRWQNAWHRGWM